MVDPLVTIAYRLDRFHIRSLTPMRPQGEDRWMISNASCLPRSSSEAHGAVKYWPGGPSLVSDSNTLTSHSAWPTKLWKGRRGRQTQMAANGRSPYRT